jgi:hypothetical protein
MPKHRANGRRWPGMLQSSKDRAKAANVVFIGRSGFRASGLAAAMGSRSGSSRDFVQVRTFNAARPCPALDSK